VLCIMLIVECRFSDKWIRSINSVKQFHPYKYHRSIIAYGLCFSVGLCVMLCFCPCLSVCIGLAT